MWNATLRRARSVLLLLLLLDAVPAAAARFHLRSQTVGQGYQQQTADRGLLARRRLSQLLGLSVLDLTGDDSDRVSLVSALRVDSDFGLSAEEVDRTRGLGNHDLTLLLGYVEARDVVPWTALRLGRQLLSDPASGLLLLDGLHVAVQTPWWVGVEALVGLEARAGVLTDSALELDGPEGDDHPTLVFGAGLAARGGRRAGDVELRVDWQRWVDAGAPDRVDREVIAVAGFWRPLAELSLSADLRWDFFVSAVDSARAQIRWRPWDFLEVQADWDHYLPVFRATSIFNVFAADPYDELGGRLSARLGAVLRLWAGAGARRYGTGGLAGGATDLVLRGGGSLAFGPRTAVGVELSHQGESGGSVRIADVTAEHAFAGWRAGLEGRLTVAHVEDALRPERRTAAFGAQLGGWYRVRDVATFHLLLEDNESSAHAHAWRVFALADLSLWLP
jgi:hypothetical protein